MDVATGTLLALVALLTLNQAAMRIEAIRERAWVFWGLNALDLLFGVGVLLFGLPGFGHVPVVRWIVGLLFVLHVAQNLKIASDRQVEEREARRAEILEERRRLRESAEEE